MSHSPASITKALCTFVACILCVMPAQAKECIINDSDRGSDDRRSCDQEDLIEEHAGLHRRSWNEELEDDSANHDPASAFMRLGVNSSGVESSGQGIPGVPTLPSWSRPEGRLDCYSAKTVTTGKSPCRDHRTLEKYVMCIVCCLNAPKQGDYFGKDPEGGDRLFKVFHKASAKVKSRAGLHKSQWVERCLSLFTAWNPLVRLTETSIEIPATEAWLRLLVNKAIKNDWYHKNMFSAALASTQEAVNRYNKANGIATKPDIVKEQTEANEMITDATLNWPVYGGATSTSTKFVNPLREVVNPLREDALEDADEDDVDEVSPAEAFTVEGDPKRALGDDKTSEEGDEGLGEASSIDSEDGDGCSEDKLPCSSLISGMTGMRRADKKTAELAICLACCRNYPRARNWPAQGGLPLVAGLKPFGKSRLSARGHPFMLPFMWISACQAYFENDDPDVPKLIFRPRLTDDDAVVTLESFISLPIKTKEAGDYGSEWLRLIVNNFINPKWGRKWRHGGPPFKIPNKYPEYLPEIDSSKLDALEDVLKTAWVKLKGGVRQLTVPVLTAGGSSESYASSAAGL
eukprot:gnl/TRDRNA2_/TRDRNA2_194238_c0_seq1.p1 gnl/TRDRNA2_/TRDRNA2_194238_c0~~gnl/TRDRNA2_/TRDRNA2_194238_c0_seq1.p1  ORF type:complete len:575 (-),score=39.12 gnl/TRDRNA2_/TRDRNA2_194238_c0_seq1:53-1777(-)